MIRSIPIPKKCTWRTTVFGMIVALVFASLGLLAPRPVHAATLTVTSSGDGNDTNLGDGLCDANPMPNAQSCTLRAAIQQAHVLVGADTINFGIPDDPGLPGLEVKTIVPDSELPAIEDRVTINGYTQPGASKNKLAKGTNAVLKIELNGENAGGSADGLSISASDSTITGLVINRFGNRGIVIDGSRTRTAPTDNKVKGNFIGTDPSGTLDYPSGTQDFGNSIGVAVQSTSEGTSGNIIGGFRPEPRNLISGNNLAGVKISLEASGNVVVGNLIGTKKDGNAALGNGDGVWINGGGALDGVGASDNRVGGDTAAGGANTIAFNSGDGVKITGAYPVRNRILRNSVFGNGALGIDLSDDGQTPNDTDDPDTGPNNLQNYPTLSSAENSGGTTTVEGTLNSISNEAFMLRFFRNASNTDQGATFIGQENVTTNAQGDGDFTFSPDNKVLVGSNITATVTDSGGNTSEFSVPKEVE